MNKKIASELAIGIILILTIVIGGIFYWQNRKMQLPVSENVKKTNQLSSVSPVSSQETETYVNNKLAISFEYPKNYSLIDKNLSDQETWPIIYFSNLPNKMDENGKLYCEDCIKISTAPINEPNWDFEKEAYFYTPRGSVKSNYNEAIFLDENQSKQVIINGKKAIHYYAISLLGEQNEHNKNYSKDLVDYSISETYYINDPLNKGRIIKISYSERVNNASRVAAEHMGLISIKDSFNKERYSVFQKVLSSIETFPIDKSTLAYGKFEKLGLSFKYPSYWGNVYEDIKHYPDSDPEDEGFLALGFRSLFFAGNNLSDINFYLNSDVYEGPEPTFGRYQGQSLKNACNKNAYLDSSYYNSKLSECKLVTLSSGLQVVIFKGSYEDDSSQIHSFKAVLISTKSKSYPGLTVVLEDDDAKKLTEKENSFDKFVNSFRYE